jgi:hypothetical protein
MQSMKRNGATRRVWRMTADNQLGEILELPDESNDGRNWQAARSRSSRSKEVTAPALFHDSKRSISRSTGEPGSQVSRAMGSASVSTWRASSYDLLQGLTVRDVSERIPRPTFEALFGADGASCERDARP